MQTQTHASSSMDLVPFTQKQNTSHMNIIFDLSGVLFSTKATEPCLLQNAWACALRPVNSGMSTRLLHDCARNGHRLFIISNLQQQDFDFLAVNPQAARLFNYFEDIVL